MHAFRARSVPESCNLDGNARDIIETSTAAMSPKVRPLTFLVPALNEEKNIEATVGTILSAAEQCVCDYEIVLINDGSTDATSQIMDRLASEDARVRVVH